MPNFLEIKKLLLESSDRELDPNVHKYIQEWDEPEPTTLQILKTLDVCGPVRPFGISPNAHAGAASSFVIKVLEVLLEDQIKAENTTYEAVVARADWRDRGLSKM